MIRLWGRQAGKAQAMSQMFRLASAEPTRSHTIATIAVFANSALLMGVRRDNGLWTMPGGHVDPGERPYEGAIRELREETGIEAPALERLGGAYLAGRSGRAIELHCYRMITGTRPTTTKHDPDEEVYSWEWIDTRRGLPPDIARSLHTPRNLLLHLCGLQAWQE